VAQVISRTLVVVRIECLVLVLGVHVDEAAVSAFRTQCLVLLVVAVVESDEFVIVVLVYIGVLYPLVFVLEVHGRQLTFVEEIVVQTRGQSVVGGVVPLLLRVGVCFNRTQTGVLVRNQVARAVRVFGVLLRGVAEHA